ncbi:MAG: replication initiator protein A [Clostridiales bacterium]|nr:replication initiator protein A [Clostridiales bacterium]
MSGAGKLPELPYFYGEGAEQFHFYRIPKVFFSDPQFSGLSTDAKVLYGLMLDRMQLSARNGWADEDGRVYIYYTVESIMKDLGCGDKKVTRLLTELERDYGLIRRKRQGLGRPTMIYVMDFTAVLSKARFQTRQNDDSGLVKSAGQDPSKERSNNTEKNKTEWSDTESIYPSGDCGMRGDEEDGEEYINYRNYFYKQLSFEALLHDYPYERERLCEILDLLVETVCSKRSIIRISGDDKPASVVKSQLMKLESEHIQYVLSCMKDTTTRIYNIKQYLLAALYNAPMTISNYYSALVNHDLHGSGG